MAVRTRVSTEPLLYCAFGSPLGELFLAASEDGLCRMTWETTEEAFAADLEDRWQRPIQPASNPARGVLGQGVQQVAEYFEGNRRYFELPVDLSHQSPFQRRVLEALVQVPFGEVVSYGELAALSGYPGAARAVGGVMRGNPLPIVIPCHRVVLSSGALGGFGGRPDLKQQLLTLEGWGTER